MATGNMIPRGAVSKLNRRTAPLNNAGMEVADSSTVKTDDLVVVAETTRVIAAVVVDGPKAPIYTLFLGKHWMKNVGLVGYCERDEHTIRTDDLRGIPVPKTRTILTPNIVRSNLLGQARNTRMGFFPVAALPSIVNYFADFQNLKTKR
ncbi:hypothetical protein N7519_000284 [Penicillium mononematosum]|uniref:uncharacterized protein n=1 Tax=Penicillium mononematosum TaxID=268346 RepID=UPI002548541F|nr:uncharacterized protein N7519_000284 [Penicillium mononematosum]KAJ6190263.1 hypothetical protein N7519_000284 [Penicillium mononematosum]